jgi:tetratricopeptide (TPR) repeat protein
MTPERVKHFKRLHIQKHQDCDAYLTVGDFNSLLADLEEAQQQIKDQDELQETTLGLLMEAQEDYEETRKQLAEAQQRAEIAYLAYEGLQNDCVSRGEYESMLNKNTVLAKAIREAKQTISNQQSKIDAALSWTWNCGEANMLEVIAALNGKEQTVLTFPNCPVCNSNNTLSHPTKTGTWLCVPCNKVFEEGETT